MKNKYKVFIIGSYFLLTFILALFSNLQYFFFYILFYASALLPIFFPIFLITCGIFEKNRKWVTGLILITIEMIAIIFIMIPMCSPIKTVVNNLNLNLYDSKIVSEKSTKGFFGDGMYYIVIDCKKSKEKVLEQLNNRWELFPLTNNLNLIMYEGNNNYHLAQDIGLPEIEDGYYLFINKHSSAKNKYRDDDLFDDHSFDFILAIYDIKTDLLYYFEYDT